MLIITGTGAFMEFLQSPSGLLLVTLTGFGLIAAPEIIDSVRSFLSRKPRKTINK